MEIKWSGDMVRDLVNVISYLKKSDAGKTLEVLGDYFIKKQKKNLVIEKYSMEFNDNVDAEKIGDGEYKLAYICELVNIHYRKEKRNQKQKKINNIYYCVSFMMRYCISKILKYTHKNDYRIFFLSYIIKEKILPEHKIENKDDKILEIINLAYYLTNEMVSISKSDETEKFEEFKIEKDIVERKIDEEVTNSIYRNRSLISHCENLDIGICDKKQIRELYSILKTRRTIFIRILLVLSFEISRTKGVLSKSWLNKFVKFNSHKEFLLVLNSPLVEVFLFITSERIKSRN